MLHYDTPVQYKEDNHHNGTEDLADSPIAVRGVAGKNAEEVQLPMLLSNRDKETGRV